MNDICGTATPPVPLTDICSAADKDEIEQSSQAKKAAFTGLAAVQHVKVTDLRLASECPPHIQADIDMMLGHLRFYFDSPHTWDMRLAWRHSSTQNYNCSTFPNMQRLGVCEREALVNPTPQSLCLHVRFLGDLV